LAASFGLLTIQSSLFTVDAGQRALIFDSIRGVLPKVKEEGTHFRIPFIQTPNYFDVRITPRSIKSDTASKDLQRIHINVRVLFRPNQERLYSIFTQYGLAYDEAIIPSIGNEVIKAVIAQFNAEELVTQRDSVSRLIRAGLVERASSFGLILEDVAITHIGFSREYTSAIERKQVESQLAERQKFIVEKSRQETFAEVILAEGETEAARVIQEAMKNISSIFGTQKN
jgi:prohibitin 1